MKQKVLLLFAMLSLSVTGAWAWGNQEYFDPEDYDSDNKIEVPNDPSDAGIYEWWQVGIGNNAAHSYYTSEHFLLLQYGGNDQTSGGAACDEDGWTAQYGIKFSGRNGAWIRSIDVTCDYGNAQKGWGLSNLVTDGTIVNYQEEPGHVSFTIVVNGETCDFSIPGFEHPQFNFAINYLGSAPVLLNTRSQLEGLVSDYKNKKAYVYHTRDFKENVATTICLPFAIEADETGKFSDGSFYELTTVTYDEEHSEWVATMTPPGLDKKNGKYTEANKPYLFLPNKTQKITFTGTINKVPSSVPNAVAVYGETTAIDNETSRKWYMQGTYDRVNFTDLNSGDSPLENVYGFVSAFNTDGDGNGTAIDFTNESVYAGEFVRAAGNAYFPIFRAYLSYLDSKLQPQISDQNPQARRDTRSNASAPSRIAVRLINNDGSVTKLDNVEIPVVSNVWYDLQGRRYNSKPAKAGIYMNNGKKMIVK